MILFTKTDCERCAWVKQNCDLTDVRVVDVETAEGLALLAYYACVGLAEKPGLPILVVDEDQGADGHIALGTIAIANQLGRITAANEAAMPDDCGVACVL